MYHGPDSSHFITFQLFSLLSMLYIFHILVSKHSFQTHYKNICSLKTFFTFKTFLLSRHSFKTLFSKTFNTLFQNISYMKALHFIIKNSFFHVPQMGKCKRVLTSNTHMLASVILVTFTRAILFLKTTYIVTSPFSQPEKTDLFMLCFIKSE